MYYPREKTPVHRVIIGLGDERREFSTPWIAVDQSDRVVHIWTDHEAPRPVVSVPLVATMIEWDEPLPDLGGGGWIGG